MTNAEKQLKEMEEQMRREQASQKKEKQGRSAKPYAVKKESHPLASFLIGLVLLGAGIYWVLNSFVVSAPRRGWMTSLPKPEFPPVRSCAVLPCWS